MNFLHYPVMNREVLEIFQGTGKKVFVDCTVGGGGHSHFILSAFPESRVIAIDQDGESLTLARENLRIFGRRVSFHSGTYINLFEDFDCRRLAVSGILVDPGISTVQLKNDRRGFSHSLDGPLDMRKDLRSTPDRRRSAQFLFRRKAGRYFQPLWRSAQRPAPGQGDHRKKAFHSLAIDCATASLGRGTHPLAPASRDRDIRRPRFFNPCASLSTRNWMASVPGLNRSRST